MALSQFFTDEELLNNLRVQFDYDEMFDFDFKQILHQIVEREKDYYLRFRGKEFSIDKVTGGVSEIIKVETTED